MLRFGHSGESKYLSRPLCGGGVKSYLCDIDEELANGIRVMDKNGFGLTREEALDIVQCFIVQSKLETRLKNQ